MKSRSQKYLKALAAACTTMLLLPFAHAADPYEKPDEAWITLNGTIADAGADSFILDYGEGMVTVEMDDWDWYAEGYQLLDGDEVRVSGRVDDDLFERTTVEAFSVYVKTLNTYYYASSDDEEDDVYPTANWHNGELLISGEVVGVNGREFTVDSGTRLITVDTSELLYNPLDNVGYQQIDLGDRVSVSGDFDVDFFEGRELMADTVTTLMEDAGKTQ